MCLLRKGCVCVLPYSNYFRFGFFGEKGENFAMFVYFFIESDFVKSNKWNQNFSYWILKNTIDDDNNKFGKSFCL